MTLTQFRYLVAIADSGLNITLAAARVHATQPGLSKQIKQMEAELGFLLFDRRGRSLAGLTPGGQQVLMHARRILEETASIRAYAANERAEECGALVIVTTHTQARYVLPPVIAGLKRTFPRISVHLQPAADREVLERLARGGADIAILSTAGAVPRNGVAIPLYRWRRVVLVPATHPLAMLGQAPSLRELAAHPLISYESSTQPESSLRQAFAQQGLELQLAMTAQDADLIRTYVRTGLGVGVLAEMAAGLPLDAELRVLPAPPTLCDCITWAVLPSTRVPRDYTLELLQGLAPQLDRRDLRRVLEGTIEPAWPAPPLWAELSQTITI
ncbi:MAG: LysR family transcriptional regulator [Solirubrobacteraceae bacterium]